jgi:hypothetical protein
MARIRAYFKVDLYFFEHPKVVDLSHSAIVLFLASIAYANRRETDGYVARPVVRRLIELDDMADGPTIWELADQLVKAGLWEEARPGNVQTDTKPRPPDGPGGWWIHGFLEDNESNEERAQRREQDAARKRRERGSEPKPAGWHPTKGRPENVQPDTDGRPDGRDTPSEPVRPIEVTEHRSNREEEPPSAGRTTATATPAIITPIPTAQTYVAAYVDAYRGRAGHDPPGRVKGQVAKHLREAFDDGIPADTIKAGFVEWFDRDQHPATLPSFIEVAGRGGRRRNGATRAQQQLDQAQRTYKDMMADASRGMGGAHGPPQSELARPADHQSDR